MPEAAPIAKVQATEGYGAKVVLHGSCYDDARVAEDALVQAMRQTAEIAVPMPNIPEMDVMWTVVSNLLTDVNLSGKDIPSSFQAAEEQAESLIAGMK